MSLVTNERLNYFAQGLYGKIKTNFDAKGSADTAETNAKTYADGLNTGMDTRVDALETTVGNAESGLVKDIAVLKGDKSVEGSVQFQIAQIVAGANANYDTLKEIADWIMSDQTGAAKMANDIKANADAITDLETLVGTIPAEATATDIVGYIAEYVQAQLTASDLSQYAKATDLEALQTKVGTASDGNTPATGLIKDIEDVTKKAQDNEDAIAILNGTDDVVGSVAKAVKDAKKYTDDEIVKVQEAVNVSAEAGNKLEKKADGLYVDAVAQADFDALDEQVNGVQATIILKENGTVTAEAATYTYNENDKFFINDLTEPVSQTYNQYQYGMENASRYIVITGEDGVVKRLTDAEGRLTTTETGIKTNAEAITQLRADVDTNIASLEDVHIDATAENKYDNTTGNINLYLNDGKVYEEIDYYYNGSDWYKLGSNATYASGSYVTINKETNTINYDVTVTEENFADMVAAGLWTYGSPLGNYPKVKTIKVVDSNGNIDYYNSKETSYYDLVQEFEVRNDRETCTLYLLIKDESTKIEVPITELKTAIENIATNSEAIGVLNGADTVEGSVAKALKDAKTYADGLAVNYATAEQGNKADAAAAAIGVETDTENSVTATGIYARLESLESVMGTASVKDDHGNVVTPATGVQKQIEDLQASQNEVITEAQIDEMINGLA